MTKKRGPSLALVAVAILAAAITLRPGATSVGPVLEEITQGLGLSSASAGVLTALPGFMFAAAGLLAVPLSKKLGIGWSIGLGLAVAAVCLLVRPYVGSGVVFIFVSGIALSGMAVGNVLVPAVIRTFGRERPAFLAGIYSTGLAVGGAAPLLMAGLLLSVTGGWQTALAFWGWLSVGAAALWGVLLARSRGMLAKPGRRSRTIQPLTPRQLELTTTDREAVPGAEQATSTHRSSKAEHGGAEISIWRSPTAVALALFFGLQSTNAYVQFGWMSQIYRDAGLSLGYSSALVGVIAVLGVPGGFAMSWLVSNSTRLAMWITGMGLCMVLGYTGLLVAPATTPYLWALLLGLGSLAFPTALALITDRSRDPGVTARVSGFVQPTGYLMAGFGPLVIGLIHGWTGSWSLPLVLMLASSFPLMYFGAKVARGRYVDDELTFHGS